MNIFGENEGGRSSKEGVNLLNLIGSLSEHLSSSSQQLSDLVSWVESRAKELEIGIPVQCSYIFLVPPYSIVDFFGSRFQVFVLT